ncbi:hypothetical protein CKO36_18700 [Rhabdochromatium marinum]|nr:hypothetical protein [Rhabdochromatium marinum]
MNQPRFAFANINIAAKLWFGIGVLLCCSILAIGAMWLGMQQIQTRFDHFIERDQKLAESYSGMYAQGLQMGQALRNIILDPSNPKAYQNLERAKKDFSTLMGQARSVLDIEDPARKGVERIDTLFDEQAGLHQRILSAIKGGDTALARQVLRDCHKISVPFCAGEIV